MPRDLPAKAAAAPARPARAQPAVRPQDWLLRKATLADLETLVRHRDAMWIEMGRVAPDEQDPTSPAYRDWLRARMENGTLTAFIAEEKAGRKVLASGGVWVQEVQPRPGHPMTMWGYILSVYTEPEARRRGLAREVVDACIAQAKAAGCTRACLHASDAGRPMYEQMGFETTAEMWLDLRPPAARPQPKPKPDPVVAAQAAKAKRRAGGIPLREQGKPKPRKRS